MILANVSLFWSFLGIVWVIVALFLALLILVQKGRGGGLSGAFGGAGGGGVLGTKTGDFLTWVTVICVGIFLLLGIALARFYKPQGIKELQTPTADTATTAEADTGTDTGTDTDTEAVVVAGDAAGTSEAVEGTSEATGENAAAATEAVTEATDEDSSATKKILDDAPAESNQFSEKAIQAEQAAAMESE